MNILIWGIGGRLGKTLVETLSNIDNATLVCGVDAFSTSLDFKVPVFKNAEEITVAADVIIDFSRADAIYDILPYAIEKNLPVVICSTGHNENDLAFIRDAATKIPVFKSANMSIGINLLIELAKKTASTLGDGFDIEIIEKHHNKKADAPSGTALTIAEAIANTSHALVFGRHSRTERRNKNEIGIHAVRGGTVVGVHDVLFMGNDEVITISHEAGSKAIFAEGAIAAARFILGKPPGIYTMSELLKKDCLQ